MCETDKLISAKDVVFSYHSDDGEGYDLPAIRGLDIDIKQGEYVAFLGPNGSGKSTLAKLIDVLEVPNEGKITVFGCDTDDPVHFWTIRENCAVVFQNPDNQIVGTTVEEDVAFGPENLGIPNPELRNRVDDALKVTGLFTKRKMQAASLSGGQKQKLAIAGALAMDPKLLILDESTAMLDPVSRDEFLALVEMMHREKGVTVVSITHDMDEAARCERVFVIKDGMVAGKGTPSEIFKNAELIKSAGLERPAHYRFMSAAEKITGIKIPEGVDINSKETASRIASEMILEAAGKNPPVEIKKKEKTDRAGEVILEVRDLSFGYDDTSLALQGINLEVRKGEILAIVGRTGCGKTTLISHFNALISPQKGEIIIHTETGDYNTSSKKDIKTIRSKIGLVFQYPEYQLFEESVYKDIQYGLIKMGVPSEKHEKRIREAITLVGLDESILKKSPFELSGGQKRRVAMAGVLVMRPSILVLDEPASGLDPRGRKEMFKIIHNLRENGTTVIIVTHNMDEAAVNADRICCIKDGRILSLTTPEELFSDYSKCKSMGIDIPKITSFARRVRHVIRETVPDIKVDGISFDPREACALIYNATLKYGGDRS